jgi:hypothetical protein
MSGRRKDEDVEGFAVVDDFDGNFPVTPAELDVVEAFLMPLVARIMAGEPASQQSISVSTQFGRKDSKVPQSPARLRQG